MFVFVTNVTFFDILYMRLINVSHVDGFCIKVSKLSSLHRAYEPFFSYFRVQIGLSFSGIQKDSESAVSMQSWTTII